MAVTKLSNLVNPEVLGGLIQEKLTNNIVFSAVATINYDLVGVPGDTLRLPRFQYIGDASVVGEASAVSVATLQASSVSVKVKKYAKAVEISDEAILSGFGDCMGEAASQVALAIGSAIDNDLLVELQKIDSSMTQYTSASTVLPSDTDILDGLELFGEDINGVKVAFVAPAVYTKMRKNTNQWIPASEVAAEIAVKGIVGEYGGCQVIVSNKLKTSGDAYVCKPGALAIILKRNVLIENDRDILHFTNVVVASLHGAAYLYDESKAIRVTKKAS